MTAESPTEDVVASWEEGKGCRRVGQVCRAVYRGGVPDAQKRACQRRRGHSHVVAGAWGGRGYWENSIQAGTGCTQACA